MPPASHVRRNNPVQELLGACSKRQLSAVGFATGVAGHRLARVAAGATTLTTEESQAVLSFLLKGAYLIKKRA